MAKLKQKKGKVRGGPKEVRSRSEAQRSEQSARQLERVLRHAQEKIAEQQPLPAVVGGLKLRQACQYLGGIHTSTLRRAIERGLITPNRKLRHLIFPVSELNRFLEEGIE
jgi:hypothetical protein